MQPPGACIGMSCGQCGLWSPVVQPPSPTMTRATTCHTTASTTWNTNAAEFYPQSFLVETDMSEPDDQQTHLTTVMEDTMPLYIEPSGIAWQGEPLSFTSLPGVPLCAVFDGLQLVAACKLLYQATGPRLAQHVLNSGGYIDTKCAFCNGSGCAFCHNPKCIEASKPQQSEECKVQ